MTLSDVYEKAGNWYIYEITLRITVMKKYLKIAFLMAISCGFTSCFQSHSDDCNYRTVPTTNNPNNIPDQGSKVTPF